VTYRTGVTRAQSRTIGIAAIAVAIAFPLGAIFETQWQCPDVNRTCYPQVLGTIILVGTIAAPFLGLAGAITSIRGSAKLVGAVGLVLSALDLLILAALSVVVVLLANGN
jgi:hypothetical protein